MRRRVSGRVGAELFAAEGAQVVIADLSDGDEAVEAIAAAGGEATFVRCDVTDEQSVEAAVQHAVETFGGLARALQQRRRDAGRRRQPGHHLRRDLPEDDGHQRARRAARLQVRDSGDAGVGQAVG